LLLSGDYTVKGAANSLKTKLNWGLRKCKKKAQSDDQAEIQRIQAYLLLTVTSDDM